MKRAFTLLELLIAVAAGALLTIAIAQVFATTGGTVQRGKRASNFNRYAALIEQQLRKDFEAMTRDGFLLIRHEVANQGPTADFRPQRVALYPAQPDRLKRYRRTDELLFFAKGRYTTARAPLAAGYVATSNEACIYYGHGARAIVDPEQLSQPQIEALNLLAYDMGIESAGVQIDEVLGRLGEKLTANEFASDWILARHVTLLTQPLVSEGQLPSTFYDFGSVLGSDIPAMLDSDRQIALQPALPSIFRAFNFAYRIPTPEQDNADDSLRDSGGADPLHQTTEWWLPASGLFDIATTDLREIRAIVTTALHDGAPPPAVPQAFHPSLMRSGGDIRDNPPRGSTPVLDLDDNMAQAYLSCMHAWMRNALPADTSDDDNLPDLAGRRMRVELSPPDLLRIMGYDDPDRTDDNTPLFAANSFQAADRRNDQLALLSSNFVPRCSEFMVEWSFNQIDPNTGETIWYGGNQLVDTNGDGVADDVTIKRYSSADPSDPQAPGLTIDRATGNYQPAYNAAGHLVDHLLIHGPEPANPNEARRPVLSYFGYHDPTYSPLNIGDLNQLPWAWPRLVRVTITLADPTDPSIEQTYQFVFKPGRRE